MKHSNTFTVGTLLLVLSLSAGAQDNGTYNWQLGIGLGYTNYYGDLSNYRIHHPKDLNKVFRSLDYNKYYTDQPSISLTLHKKITPTLGLMLQANHLSFAMSDRYRKKSGSFDTSSMNYARSLNFRTRLQDVGLAFTFNANNGKVFPEDAFFYPTVYFGAGVSHFIVKGDLYDENGNPYNYRLPGNIMDGSYETNLRDLRTETQSRYPSVVPYVDLGVALNFRLNELFTISLQSDIKYSASDYLDDASGRYKDSYPTLEEQYAAKPGYNTIDPLTMKRGNDNSLNDFYINNRVVFTLGLSRKSRSRSARFNAPVIYALGVPNRQHLPNDSSSARAERLKQDSLLAHKADSVLKQKKDSITLATDSSRSVSSLNRGDSNVQRQLESITAELIDIKNLLKDQAVRPRYQQLQFQADSVRALRNKIRQQRSPSREDNLRVRIYDLQLDSLQNELQRLQWNGETRMRADSGKALYKMTPAGEPGNFVMEGRADSLLYEEGVVQQGLDDGRQGVKSPDGKDTVIYRPDPKRIDSLQQKLYELQRRVETKDTAQVTGQIMEPANEPVLTDTLAVNENIARIETRLQQTTDSVALLRNRLQRSNDSAAYYRRMAFAASGGERGTDTVVKKKKWLQRIFESEKKKNKTVEKENADTRYIENQRYYDQEADRMQRAIREMEDRSKDLEKEYESLDRNRKTRRSETSQAPVIIYDRNNNQRVSDKDYSDYLALRNELDRLRNEVSTANQRTYLNEQNAQGFNARPDLANGQVTAPSTDSSHIRSMRSELDQIRNELDSLRNYRAPVVKNEPAFDVNSFPVISVYFNTGSSALTSDQAGKINPFAKLAASHPDVNIALRGFTDPVGNASVNMALAKKRSAYVKNLLTGRYKIAEARITVEEPSAGSTGRVKKANPLDRRVDLTFKQQEIKSRL